MSRGSTATILPMDNAEPDFLLKIVLIGDSGVGKTNLLSQFARGQFNQDSKTTIGVEFATKTITVANKTIKAQIWDTAGQERYRAITSAYYKGAIGAMLLYDITSSVSFNSLPRWLKELRDNADENMIVMLVGNKCDMDEMRSVTQNDGINFANSEKLLFIETSAKDATNVHEAFTKLIENIVESYSKSGFGADKKSTQPRPGVAIQSDPEDKEKNKQGCC